MSEGGQEGRCDVGKEKGRKEGRTALRICLGQLLWRLVWAGVLGVHACAFTSGKHRSIGPVPV